MKRLRRKRIVCNAFIVFFVVLGIILNYREPNVAKHTILYFTTLSNLWIGAVCLVFVGFDLSGKTIPKALSVIKFMFTVSIALTGVVYNLILAPFIGAHYGSILKAYSASVLILHTVVPVLSLLSYLVFDEAVLRKSYAFTGIVMPLAYFALIIALSLALPEAYLFDGIDGTPSKVPYFFLDYVNNGWFTLGGGQTFGVFYWVLIAIALVLLFGFALLALQKLCYRKIVVALQKQKN